MGGASTHTLLCWELRGSGLDHVWTLPPRCEASSRDRIGASVHKAEIPGGGVCSDTGMVPPKCCGGLAQGKTSAVCVVMVGRGER